MDLTVESRRLERLRQVSTADGIEHHIKPGTAGVLGNILLNRLRLVVDAGRPSCSINASCFSPPPVEYTSAPQCFASWTAT